MQIKHERFSSADVCSSDRCEIQWISLSEGSESLSTSLTCPSILQVVESSVKIMCESSEDMTSPSEIMILKFPSSNMSIAFLDLSVENQKGGYIKPNRIKLLKYSFPSGTSIVSEWHLVSFRIPIVCPLSLPFPH